METNEVIKYIESKIEQLQSQLKEDGEYLDKIREEANEKAHDVAGCNEKVILLQKMSDTLAAYGTDHFEPNTKSWKISELHGIRNRIATLKYGTRAFKIHATVLQDEYRTLSEEYRGNEDKLHLFQNALAELSDTA